jgi:hypothetical protein
MTDISSKIDRAKSLAAEHDRHAKAAAAATKKRDTCLYRLLDIVHQIDVELRILGKKEAGGELQAKFGASWPKNPNDFLKRIYPELPPKRRSKYVALIQYVRTRKGPDRPLRNFVRLRGGINLTKAKPAPDIVKKDNRPRKRPRGR